MEPTLGPQTTTQEPMAKHPIAEAGNERKAEQKFYSEAMPEQPLKRKSDWRLTRDTLTKMTTGEHNAHISA